MQQLRQARYFLWADGLAVDLRIVRRGEVGLRPCNTRAEWLKNALLCSLEHPATRSREDESQFKSHKEYLKVLLHAGFILTGAVNTMLGPLLPLLSARWALSDAQAGLLFTAQFGGSVCGVLASSVVVVRRGHRFCLVLGLSAMAAGSAMLLRGGYGAGLRAALLLGIGLGLAIPTTNLAVSAMNPQRRAAALSLINLSWGAGAVGCPLLLAALVRLNHVSLFLDGLVVLLILLVVSMTQISFPILASFREPAATGDASIWRSRWIPILGALFFFYVGSEGGVSGWIATCARRVTGGAGTTWLLMPSLFWMALLGGRATAPMVLRRVRELKLAQWGLGLSCVGILVLLAAKSLGETAIGAGLAGLGFSSAFPIAIASVGRKFGEMESRVAGLMFALAGCGGATLPWLAGYVSTALGGLRYGLVIPLCGCLAMLILNARLSRPE